MYNKIKKLKKKHKIIFSLLVGLSIISFWRGIWGLMDIYLFPSNYELSSWVSMAAGLAVLYSTHYIVKELM